MTATATYPALPSSHAPLPDLVRTYLGRALPAGGRPASLVRLGQTGTMKLKPGGRDLRFDAVEDIAIEEVAFSWKATVRVAPFVRIHALDSYAAGAGRLDATLFGFPVSRAFGRETAVGEAMRYLAELPWAPQAMAANRDLAWAVDDDRIVEVSITIGDDRAAVCLRFDDVGDVLAAFGHRPHAEGGKVVPRAWMCLYHDYAELGGIRIPTRAEVRWDFPDGPFPYWRGQVVSLEAS
jgi:hypothetical protein